jgi:N-acetylneuraminic acid mutarotase
MILAWAGRAQEEESSKRDLIVEPPPQMIDTEWIPPALEKIELQPLVAMGGPASDSCESATPLNFSFAAPGDGGSTIVNLFTIAPTDPRFSCIWGAPTRREGYRTAWYTFTAPDTGKVTIQTSGTNYDTVLAVFTGSCSALAELACSDDALGLGFQSRVTLNVVRGTIYYVEVADWQSGVAHPAELRLSAVIRPLESRWRQVANIPTGGLSRHATAVFNEWIYVIGGEEVVGQPPHTIPVITNRAWAFNTRTNLFTQLTSMPGTGFANTTAALLNGKIYIPGGYSGNNTFFDPTHWVYDIATDFWSKAAPLPFDLATPETWPQAWAAAVVPPDQSVYYLTGGLRTQPEITPQVEVVSQTLRYTPATNSWQTLQAIMNTKRYGHTAAWIAGKGICVVGGLTTAIPAGETDPVTMIVQGDGTGTNLTGAECLLPFPAGPGVWQPIADMHFPRYNAASAVGPDGRWYVYGGLSETAAIAEMEVYDPATNTWQLLDGSFSLGGLPAFPAREWPRGGIVGSTFYAIGGNTYTLPSNGIPIRGAVSLVERLRLPPGLAPQQYQAQMPMVALNAGNLFLASALPLLPGVPVEGNFVANDQFHVAYYFDWPTFGRATVFLTQIPDDWNLDLAIYNHDKQILGESHNLPGDDELVSLTLAPGRYYAVVQRLYPPSDIDPNVFYRIVLQ